ncbi:unnamed protein product [Chrysoparadoxa australica]
MQLGQWITKFLCPPCDPQVPDCPTTTAPGAVSTDGRPCTSPIRCRSPLNSRVGGGSHKSRNRNIFTKRRGVSTHVLMEKRVPSTAAVNAVPTQSTTAVREAKVVKVLKNRSKSPHRRAQSEPEVQAPVMVGEKEGRYHQKRRSTSSLLATSLRRNSQKKGRRHSRSRSVIFEPTVSVILIPHAREMDPRIRGDLWYHPGEMRNIRSGFAKSIRENPHQIQSRGPLGNSPAIVATAIAEEQQEEERRAVEARKLEEIELQATIDRLGVFEFSEDMALDEGDAPAGIWDKPLVSPPPPSTAATATAITTATAAWATKSQAMLDPLTAPNTPPVHAHASVASNAAS